MKKINYPLVITILLLTSAFTFIKVQDWGIKPDFSVKFSGKYAEGIFETLKGNIKFDENKLPESNFDITIDVASINTGNSLKNRHAKGDKWFDAEKYPVIHFISNSVTKAGNSYEVKGELEMHGTKKSLTIPFTFTKNGSLGVFNTKFKVNQADFGIGESKGNEKDITALDITVPVNSK